MNGLVDLTWWLVDTLPVQLALIATVVIGFALAGPISARLNWSKPGTMFALWGLGGALSVTFVNRLGRKDLVWEPEVIGQCLGGITRDWTGSEALLNVLLLVPLGFGIAWASRSFLLGTTVVVATAIWIELLQGVTGLGGCERGDIVRNVAGGLVGVLIGWVVAKATGDRGHARPNMPTSTKRR